MIIKLIILENDDLKNANSSCAQQNSADENIPKFKRQRRNKEEIENDKVNN